MKNRHYYIVTLEKDEAFMIRTDNELPEKMIRAKVNALTDEPIRSIEETNKAKDVIMFCDCTYNIDKVYDENQGEGFNTFK